MKKPFPIRALLAWNDGRFCPHVSAFGGGGSTNTVQTADPWVGQQGYLTDIYNQANYLDQNASPQYYPYNTYQPLTPQQNSLIGSLESFGGGGGTSGLQAANQNITSTLSPAYTAQTQGTFNAGNNVLNSELQPGYLNPNNSPAYQTAVSNAIAAAVPSATSSFTNGNRSDSGLAQAASSSAAANAAGGLAQQQYNANQQIQQGAAAQAASNLLAQQSNQARDTLTAPMVDQATNAELSSALNAAGLQQSDLQNQLNANIQAYNYQQMQPWNQLGLYESAITGTGSPGGTTTTSQPYFSNTGANLLGLGTSALAGGAAINSLWPSFFPAVGTLLGLSDVRLKEDIRHVGETDTGFPLYMFRYKGEPSMAMHIGVMAQDVERTMPEAVIDMPGGYKMVDYGMALQT